MASQAQIEKVKRRYYIRQLPYALRNIAKDLGCKWDRDERCWWTGKASTADEVLSRAANSNTPEQHKNWHRGLDQVVVGVVSYKGHKYYAAGTPSRGHYDEYETLTTRDGTKQLLCFRDGSKSFWAVCELVYPVRYYQQAKTIGSLHAYAAAKKAEREATKRREEREAVERSEAMDTQTTPVKSVRVREHLMPGSAFELDGQAYRVIRSYLACWECGCTFERGERCCPRCYEDNDGAPHEKWLDLETTNEKNAEWWKGALNAMEKV